MALNKKNAITIRRRQLSELLMGLRKGVPKRPPRGWIREIRELLLINSAQLARRVGIAPTTMVRLEQSESKRTISLSTLEKIAEKLECELHYVLVPKRDMEEILLERAEKLLRREEKRVERSMGLEQQGGVKRSATRRALDKADLIARGDRKLWDEE